MYMSHLDIIIDMVIIAGIAFALGMLAGFVMVFFMRSNFESIETYKAAREIDYDERTARSQLRHIYDEHEDNAI